MAVILDDSQLLRLAADPRTRLFPSLRGSTIFWPIVLIAGWLPCVVAVTHSELHDESAAWALRVLDTSSSVDFQGWLQPGRNGSGNLADQPPLVAWLQAAYVPRLGIENLSNWLGLSLVSACATVYVAYLLGRRIGGSALGLVTSLVICAHPILLRFATDAGPVAVGILLITLTAWGFLGHLEGPLQLISVRLILGAVTLGLAILAVGPVALALMIPMALHVWLMSRKCYLSGEERHRVMRIRHAWLGIRTLLLFTFTATFLSAWWPVLMFANHGSAFLQSWWTGNVTSPSSESAWQPLWRTWFGQNSLICCWVAAGLVSSFREIRTPSTEHQLHRHQFVLCWWLTALGLRLLFDLPLFQGSLYVDGWNALLLLPTALLAAIGVRAVVLRQFSPFIEALILVVTVGLFIWHFTNNAMLGAIGFGVGILFVSLTPVIKSQSLRAIGAWTERDWKRFLRFAIIVQFILHIGTGLHNFQGSSSDSASLVEVRRRISTIDAVPRVTFLTMNKVPESLVFVLRSHWPDSQFTMAGSREGAVTDILAPSAPIASLEEIVIELTRRDFRLATEFTPNRQMTAIGDPLKFRGRRIMLYRVKPRDR